MIIFNGEDNNWLSIVVTNIIIRLLIVGLRQQLTLNCCIQFCINQLLFIQVNPVKYIYYVSVWAYCTNWNAVTSWIQFPIDETLNRLLIFNCYDLCMESINYRDGKKERFSISRKKLFIRTLQRKLIVN